MANSVVQTIKDAEIDARSLSEFISKDASFTVTRRLAPTIHTLDYYLLVLNTVKDKGDLADMAISDTLDKLEQLEPTVIQRVEDAINNTAIEGGVLADTFVVVDGSLSQRTINRGLESISDLSTINNPKDGLRVYVKSYHAGLGKGGGYFTYDSTKSSVNNGVTIFDGFVAENQTNLSIYSCGVIGIEDHESYTDHDAMRRLAALITSDATTDYVIDFEDAVIVVGKTIEKPNTAWQDSEYPFALDFREYGSTPVKKSVKLISNGAKLIWRNGLKVGTFSRSTGERVDPTFPFHPGTSSWNAIQDSVYVYPVGFQIRAINIDSIEIQGYLECDGNSGNHIVGGGYGDSGWQLGGYGIQINLTNKIRLNNIKSYDQIGDGFYCANGNGEDCFGIYTNLVGLKNGRQGFSLTGGSNVSFYDCVFNDNGLEEHPTASLPKSNLDIEAEVNKIRNVNLYNCKFINSGRESIVSDSHDISNVTFYNCDIAGNSSIWINKPGFKFVGGTISGLIQKLYGTDTPKDRLVFDGVRFSDSTMVNENEWFIQSVNANPYFKNCHFKIDKSKWFYSTNTTLSNSMFELENCVVDFSYATRAILGLFKFVDLTIIDSREDPSKAMTVYLDQAFANTVKIVSKTGSSGLTLSHGHLEDPVMYENIVKVSVGNPNLDYKVNYYDYVHKQGATTVTNSNNLIKILYADSINDIHKGTLQYNKGDTVHCTDPVAQNGIQKWVCTKAGVFSSTEWEASTNYSANQYISSNGKVYKSVSAGVSGTTAPSHSSSTASDGSISWEYAGVLAVFQAYS